MEEALDLSFDRLLMMMMVMWVSESSALLSAVSNFMCWYCECKRYSEELLINDIVLPKTTVMDLM